MDLGELIETAWNVIKGIFDMLIRYREIVLGIVILTVSVYGLLRLRRFILIGILKREGIKRGGTVDSKNMSMTYRYKKNLIKVSFYGKSKYQPKRTVVECNLRIRKNVIFIVRNIKYIGSFDYTSLKPLKIDREIEEYYEVRGNNDYFMLKLMDQKLKRKILDLKDRLLQISLTGSIYDRYELKIIVKGIMREDDEFNHILKLAENLIDKVIEPSLVSIG